ncbi:MAG: sialate O-acetylesterase [Saprospiraceae bacterium]
MKFVKIYSIIVIVVFLFGCSSTKIIEKRSSAITLNKLFSDHMVIQRDKTIHIIGEGSQGLMVSAELSTYQASTIIDNEGRFDIALPPLKAGGPFTLAITTKDTSITINDVLIGDIWICSGQSNMEFELHESNQGASTIRQPKSNLIRMINIPKDKELKPIDGFRNKMKWYRADVDTINKFSAVGVYFALELEKKLNIPIGLIGSNWGGTNIESWMRINSLEHIAEYKSPVEFIKTNTLTVKDIDNYGEGKFANRKDSLFVKGIGLEQKWYNPNTDITSWQTINVPGFWEDQITALKNYDGVVWYRREFDTTEDFNEKDLKIWLSQIHDYDMTWLNGVKIGETYSTNTWRGYTADKNLIKEKNNVLVVRVYNRRNSGGFAGISAYFDYYPDGAKEHAMSLAGGWLFKAEQHINDTKDIPMSNQYMGPNAYPSLLYNTMINPMTNFPIKGIIWYQGEANASKAYMYQKLFPTMITDWRNQWDVGDFPFYFVQLANFGPENDKFGDSDWAELREAQSMTLSLPNTGMATIIDIGNADDIHPKNKIDVGKRLAYNALNNTYNVPTPCLGPTYNTHKIKDSNVIINFNNIDNGLVTDDKEAPKEFIIAGKNKIFYPANAVILNNTIIVSSDLVKKPAAVRYAWKNSPVVNLFNKEGLPALPFRTDRWKGTTE